MIPPRVVLAFLFLVLPLRSAFSASDAPQILNLNCMAALASAGETRLAGVFFFIPDKDQASAFADLIAHDPKALKKYAEKLEKDFKAAAGITSWDHKTLTAFLALYESPLARTLRRPSKKLMGRLIALDQAPAFTLGEMTQKKGGP